MKKHKFTTIDISAPAVGKPFVMQINSWIICKDGDPKQAVVYDSCSLQGNRNHKSIADKHCIYVSEVTGWSTSVIFMEIYYEPYASLVEIREQQRASQPITPFTIK